jgi:DedD protein
MAADNTLKQRLVGGAALLVIGMIAWFWLLSADSPVDPVDRSTQIPPAPELKPFAVQEPAAQQDIPPLDANRSEPEVPAAAPAIAPTPAPKSAPAPAAKPAVAAAPAQKPELPAKKTEPKADAKKPEAKPVATAKPAENFQLDAQGLPVAWVVQVGLFATQANADKVKAQLQEKGFKAYTDAFKPASGKPGVKVFVGPKLSRERADAQKKEIDQVLKTNTMVVRFQAA